MDIPDTTTASAALLHGLRAPHRLRKHQQHALDALDAAVAAGRQRAWVVLPPGAGKTLVGLETARRLGEPAVVLSPNTAIQAQWVEGWDAFLPVADHPARAGTDRDLEAFFTALTYQSLATFLPDDEVDEDGTEQSLMTRLHPNGRELVARLKACPRVTLVLDECHHLLEVWGRLLSEVLEQLPNAFVLGLTATPPATLTLDQQQLVDELFGGIVYQTSIPAVVREGHLAPFAELAWLTTPSPGEADYIAGQAERFAELVNGLTDPGFGSVGFLEWCDRRFVRATERSVSWQELASRHPDLCDAALRLHHEGLLALPEGARMLEQHRRAPSADDWVLLIDDWARNQLLAGGGDADEQVLETVRRALPAVGYRWTRRGIRKGRSPVDRVLARSEAKVDALVQIVAAEQRNLGERLRMLVLCDHERASGALPVDLRGVMPQQAGSAWLALERLLADPGTAALSPVLVTGSVVAGAPATLRRLAGLVARVDPRLAETLAVTDRDGPAAVLEGRWESRDWVPWVTGFFESGACQVLVGTRALLGEGWDAPATTGLVDLTTATTATAVVQTRGRALRLDPGWPDKVALTWTVVCVSDRHPKGAADWDRFVRKHEGFYGVDDDGDVVDGVAHVSAGFSPYAPPPCETFAAGNAAMVLRSEQRSVIADRWRVGRPYDDLEVTTLRVVARAVPPDDARAPKPPAVVRPTGLDVRPGQAAPWRPHPVVVLAAVAALALLLPWVPAPAAGAVAALLGAAAQAEVAARRGRRLAEEACRPPAVAQVARAVADALQATGRSTVGASGVQVGVEAGGEYRCALLGVPPDVSAEFATALDEVVSPMASPRYVLPRYVVLPPRSRLDGALIGLRAATGRLRPEGEVWHSVPTVLAGSAADAHAFARAWDEWVGGGPAVWSGSPEGAGVLATHRGSDPFDATTVLRRHWR